MTSLPRNISFPLSADRLLARVTGGIALAVATLLALLIAMLAIESGAVLAKVGIAPLATGREWFPSAGEFGLLSMLWATIIASLGAILIAMPCGVAIAVLGRFYAIGPVSVGLRRIMELLAGIPSVVYGLWGLTVLVPWLARLEPPGANLLCAILILALMILPTVALTSEAALRGVSEDRLRGAAALGLSRHAVVLHVALPEVRGGIATGVVLALMRALGETMAVLMVAGNVVQTPTSLFDPVRVLTANIALEMPYAVGVHRSALFASGFLLMLIVSVLAFAASRAGKAESRG